MRYHITVWIETHLTDFTISEDRLLSILDFFFERGCKIVSIKDAS